MKMDKPIGGHRSAIWRTGDVADRANFQNQTVQRDWRGLSSTRKIKKEALQKKQAHETGRGRHRSAIWRTGHVVDRANIQNQTVWKIGVAGVAHGKSRRRLHKRIRRMKPAEEGTGALYGGLAMLQSERTFKIKQSRAIAVVGVAYGKSRRRLYKRIRRMKPAKEGIK